MNLRNRLKKLENVVIDDSAFCDCRPRKVFEIYKANLSEDSNSSEPVLTSEPVPDICPDCRKPIEKTQIIFQSCDHTTKDRFPEEWQANRNK
jgi:hypothetical protein